jgi:SAM-dependent methyltransferase
MDAREYAEMASAEDSMWWYRGLHARLIHMLRVMHLPPGAAILDAGCGTGGFLAKLQREMPDHAIDGLELNSDAVAIARRKTGLGIARGSVNAMPFSDDAFDAIVSADVLYHRQVDEMAALSEFRRCLKPGGRLLVHAAAYDWMKSTHDERVHTARRYTAGRLRTALDRAGLRCAFVGYRNSLLFPLMAAWRLTAGRRGESSDTHSYPAWQERTFYALLAAENGLARIGIGLPFGGSVLAAAVKA